MDTPGHPVAAARLFITVRNVVEGITNKVNKDYLGA